MKAVIIAAGRGIRMGSLTDERPKCLLELNGISLLQNLVNRFQSFGINDIAIITGYSSEKINFPGLTIFKNENYENNNILHSLMHASEFIDEDTIISYSDIWLDDEPLCYLINNPNDLVLSVDTDWMNYYRGRTEHPVTQAENVFFNEDSIVKRIGKHLDPDSSSDNESCGEFIGLFKIGAAFTKTFITLFKELESSLAMDDPFQQSQSWQKAYLTDFFSEIISRGYNIHCSIHEQGWAEIDTAQDYERQVTKFKELEYFYKKKVGALILSEANDLKRTVPAMANELKLDVKELQAVLNGDQSIEDLQKVIELMGNTYPIDSSALMLPKDDCDNGVRIMRMQQTRSSSRIFDRNNRDEQQSPYYEYRDTAMSNLAPFRPEWIKVLRVVDDNDPDNPDVIYNNGHFMHQITFFIGPVNFYWEVNGKKYCQEMNTGDSNYITPFWPHSFASRISSEEAIIIAVTFGGEVRRSQKELYSLGKRAEKFPYNSRIESQAYASILDNLLKNEILNPLILKNRQTSLSNNLDILTILKGTHKLEKNQLFELASLLDVELSEVLIPDYNPNHEVMVKKRDDVSSYLFPDDNEPVYRVYPAVRTPKMSGLKGFELEVLPGKSVGENLSSNLHSYLYNFGDCEIYFNWDDGDKKRNSILFPGDSAYLQPFVAHTFNVKGKAGKLFIVRVSGSINFSTRKELSSFSDTRRAFKETMCWFK